MLPGITTAGLANATSVQAPTGNAKSEFDIQNLSFILGYQPTKTGIFMRGQSIKPLKVRLN